AGRGWGGVACSGGAAGWAGGAGTAAFWGAGVPSLTAAGAVSRAPSAAAPAAAAVSLDVAAAGAPASCAVAEAPICVARIKAKAVLAKMRSKRGPFIRTLSQKFPQTRATCGTLRSVPPAPSRCEPDVDSPIEATEQIIAGEFGLIAGEVGRFWPLSAACNGRANSFLNNCHRITT